MSSNLKELPWRPGVGICIFNRAGKVWVGRRFKRHETTPVPQMGKWQLPQGGIDEDETSDQALYRELKEEVGIDHQQGRIHVLNRNPTTTRYDFPEYVNALPNHDYSQKWRGQEHVWYALLYTGQDADFQLSNEWNVGREEFDQFNWRSFSNFADSPDIIGFKVDVYREVIDFFQVISDQLASGAHIPTLQLPTTPIFRHINRMGRRGLIREDI